jgi:hypothetical protein
MSRASPSLSSARGERLLQGQRIVCAPALEHKPRHLLNEYPAHSPACADGDLSIALPKAHYASEWRRPFRRTRLAVERDQGMTPWWGALRVPQGAPGIQGDAVATIMSGRPVAPRFSEHLSNIDEVGSTRSGGPRTRARSGLRAGASA